MLKLAVCVTLVSLILVDSVENALPSLDGRIVGGSQTTIEKYPHQISLRYFASHICGGVIISPTWVLTAAHCVIGAVLPVFLTIRTASSYVDNGGRVITVLSTIVHPSYDGKTYDYDIALVRLSESATSNPNARAAALPSAQTGPNPGEIATITGWGALNEGGASPNVLQEVQVPVISHDDCQKAYSKYLISPRMFCAGLLGEGGKDACSGDSGGPVIVNEVLYGLVSWGVGCAQSEFPGVYTNVANLRQWVQENIGE